MSPFPYAPAIRELTKVVTEVTMTSSSPASSAYSAVGLLVILMTSPARPFFLSKPFSWTTQMGLLAGLSPAQAMRIFSCAAARTGAKTTTAPMKMANETTADTRRIVRLLFFSAAYKGLIAYFGVKISFKTGENIENHRRPCVVVLDHLQLQLTLSIKKDSSLRSE